MNYLCNQKNDSELKQNSNEKGKTYFNDTTNFVGSDNDSPDVALSGHVAEFP